jgi:hypothetical protein
MKGMAMTDSNEIGNPRRDETAEEQHDQPELRGRYIKGDYGDAGVQTGHLHDDEEGQYSQGDFGEAGKQGGLPEPLGSKATEAGRFVKGDYDEAGTAGGRTAESEIGRYTEGDYGREGVVAPAREATTELNSTAEPE